MNQIEDYIIVKNTISKEICQSLIDENNKKEWKKHTWNNYKQAKLHPNLQKN